VPLAEIFVTNAAGVSKSILKLFTYLQQLIENVFEC